MERLWTKSFIVMNLGTLFLFIAFYMLYPTLPVFIKKIGGNASDIGLSMGIFMMASVILRPIIGGLLDRYGRRPFIVLGLVFFALAMYMYGWIGGIVFLMVLRIFHGMTWAVSTTSTLTAITDLIPSARLGEGMGWSGMAMTLAMAVGPMFGLWISQNHSFHSLFLVAGTLSIFALALTFGAKIPTRPKSDVRKIEFFERSALPVAASVFFLFIAYGGLTSFIPLFATAININSGLFFLVYAITLVLIRPLSGTLSDRYSETSIIIPALIVTILALLVLSLSNGLVGVLFSAILYGVGFGAAQPALQASIIRLVRPDRIGVANASFTTATDLGIGLGAMLLGWISRYTSYRGLFTVSAVSVVISLLLFIFFARHLLKNKVQHQISNDSLPSKTKNA